MLCNKIFEQPPWLYGFRRLNFHTGEAADAAKLVDRGETAHDALSRPAHVRPVFHY